MIGLKNRAMRNCEKLNISLNYTLCLSHNYRSERKVFYKGRKMRKSFQFMNSNQQALLKGLFFTFSGSGILVFLLSISQQESFRVFPINQLFAPLRE